jgi:hypothetical protein
MKEFLGRKGCGGEGEQRREPEEVSHADTSRSAGTIGRIRGNK